MLRRKRQGGFTLIELLIVVAIIGIIAAILIPNLLDALQKAKQKRTVADIRNTGTAWMSWLTDQVGSASAGAARKYLTAGFEDVTYIQLFGYLHPTDTFFYMQEVPQKDGWRYLMSYGKNSNVLASNVMIICSGGRDGPDNPACETTNWFVAPFISTAYNTDIVWADGYMISWPGQVD